MQKYTITLDEMKTMNFKIGGFSKKKRKRKERDIASEASAFRNSVFLEFGKF